MLSYTAMAMGVILLSETVQKNSKTSTAVLWCLLKTDCILLFKYNSVEANIKKMLFLLFQY
jgi:hypothetical protein